MSGAAVVAYLLSNAAEMIASVPAARIFSAPELPMRTTLPAINVAKISRARRLTVAMAEQSVFVTERVQVMVHAKSGAALSALIDLVYGALPQTRGVVNGVHVDSILPDLESVDLSQPDAGVHDAACDFIVKWTTVSTLQMEGDFSDVLLEDGSRILLEG